jgi:prefoldin subunit 5
LPTFLGTFEISARSAPGGVAVTKSSDKEIEQIEQTQEALRESIEQAKELSDKAQRLLQKHKKTVEHQSD